MRPVSDASDNASTDRLATVVEAAEILGITPDAVRSRLRRDTLKRSPERGEDGEVLVVLPATRKSDKSETVADQSTNQSEDQSTTDRDASPTVAAALVERMASEIDYLRDQLDQEREANRENRRLLAAALERIPELEAPRETPADESGAPVPPSESADNGGVPPEQQEASQPRSWWQRFFLGG
jgi:hypothetical protein